MKYFNRGPQPFGETAQGSHHSSYRCQLVRPLHHTPNCTCSLREKKCCAETDAKHVGELNTPLGQCENLKFARKVEELLYDVFFRNVLVPINVRMVAVRKSPKWLVLVFFC